MSKLGDLIVRLRLQPEDYEKGLKKADKDTKGFSGKLSKSISVIKAAWAAVGVAVVAAAKTMVTQMSKASNNVGDFMAVKARQIGAVWQTMLTSITAGFDNFLERARLSARAAKALQEMEDAEFEMLNSVKLRRAELDQTLVQLEIDSRDATKSYEERKKAAEQYLTLVKELYDIEKNYYKELARQSAESWLDSASNPQGKILGYNESNAGALYQFLKDYGADTGLQEAVKNYREAWKGAGDLWFTTKKGKDALRWVNENRQDWAQTQYRRSALDIGWAYEEQKNDELNGTKLVDIIEKYLNAVSAYDTETKKMQNNLNSLTAQVEKGTDLDLSEETEQVNYLAESLERLNGINGPAAAAMTIPDIIPDDWLTRNRAKIDEALAEAMRLQGITEDINMMFENAVAGSLSGATQALTDAIAGIEGADASQVLAALLQPFASTMTQMGEMLIVEGAGIKAFKESLKSLNPAVAIGAGAALIALGAALSSGIQALGSSAGSSATTASSSAVASSSVSGKEFKSEQTIYVKGKISGADILIAGDNQRNKWSR
jgi:hypothetical protein